MFYNLMKNVNLLMVAYKLSYIVEYRVLRCSWLCVRNSSWFTCWNALLELLCCSVNVSKSNITVELDLVVRFF